MLNKYIFIVSKVSDLMGIMCTSSVCEGNCDEEYQRLPVFVMENSKMLHVSY